MAVSIPVNNSMLNLNHQRAWVVAVDMGYGHQRAADPLRHIAYGGEVINANNYPGIPEKDKKVWHESRSFYEFISRFKKVPLIGEWAFNLFDKFQEIPLFYPRRDLSRSNIQLAYMMRLIKKKHWGEHLIRKLEEHPLPLITTFFVTAFMAEYYNYPGEIYAVVTDTDLSRTWVPVDPRRSRIKFLAPSDRAVERLKSYGVPEENIFYTGFPLPIELLGEKNLDVLRHDLGKRLINLDPTRHYLNRYKETVIHHLGEENFPGPKAKPTHPLTIMFGVGGAGAQKEIGVELCRSYADKIKRGVVRIVLVAGTHQIIEDYFRAELIKLDLKMEIGKSVIILHNPNKEQYFRDFNKWLHQSDILWTKPSELSFYTALGLPIIMSPPIGSQEKFNRRWLHMVGSGLSQDNTEFAAEWINDLLNTGWFAEAAMQGFLEAPKFGTYNILKIISSKPEECLHCRTEMRY